MLPEPGRNPSLALTTRRCLPGCPLSFTSTSPLKNPSCFGSVPTARITTALPASSSAVRAPPSADWAKLPWRSASLLVPLLIIPEHTKEYTAFPACACTRPLRVPSESLTSTEVPSMDPTSELVRVKVTSTLPAWLNAFKSADNFRFSDDSCVMYCKVASELKAGSLALPGPLLAELRATARKPAGPCKSSAVLRRSSPLRAIASPKASALASALTVSPTCFCWSAVANEVLKTSDPSLWTAKDNVLPPCVFGSRRTETMPYSSVPSITVRSMVSALPVLVHEPCNLKSPVRAQLALPRKGICLDSSPPKLARVGFITSSQVLMVQQDAEVPVGVQ
mmetsp:Transcript_96397/g.267795  ORF Transcript_96397/g.267795 Transcript_96397/m.267795 type:complete len:336 (+) Transcript_96397:972-1979(+)